MDVIEIVVNNREPIINELVYGSVSGKKVDENGKPLGGAVIGLFKDAEGDFTTENALMTTTSADMVVFLLPIFLMALGMFVRLNSLQVLC